MKKKVIASLGLAIGLVAGSTGGAVAASNLQEIKAYLNKGIKINLNGQAWQATDSTGKSTYPITYNGTTYLPVSSIGKALGVKVAWDGPNNTVKIGETPAAIGSTRTNPASIKQTVSVTADTAFGNFTASVSVQEIIRGEAAWQMISSANMFNDEAPTGYEYLLARVNVQVAKVTPSEESVEIVPILFKLHSSDGREYESPSVVVPDPDVRTEMYAGASHEGWVALLVKTDDANPVISFAKGYNGTGGAWFKTN